MGYFKNSQGSYGQNRRRPRLHRLPRPPPFKHYVSMPFEVSTNATVCPICKSPMVSDSDLSPGPGFNVQGLPKDVAAIIENYPRGTPLPIKFYRCTICEGPSRQFRNGESFLVLSNGERYRLGHFGWRPSPYKQAKPKKQTD